MRSIKHFRGLETCRAMERSCSIKEKPRAIPNYRGPTCARYSKSELTTAKYRRKHTPRSRTSSLGHWSGSICIIPINSTSMERNSQIQVCTPISSVDAAALLALDAVKKKKGGLLTSKSDPCSHILSVCVMSTSTRVHSRSHSPLHYIQT